MKCDDIKCVNMPTISFTKKELCYVDGLLDTSHKLSLEVSTCS